MERTIVIEHEVEALLQSFDQLAEVQASYIRETNEILPELRPLLLLLPVLQKEVQIRLHHLVQPLQVALRLALQKDPPVFRV